MASHRAMWNLLKSTGAPWRPLSSNMAWLSMGFEQQEGMERGDCEDGGPPGASGPGCDRRCWRCCPRPRSSWGSLEAPVWAAHGLRPAPSHPEAWRQVV